MVYAPLTALSVIGVLFVIIPIIGHIKKKNIGAITLSVWLLLANIIGFINSIIWGSSDVEKWWIGYGYCDLVLRFYVTLITGVSCANIAVARNLSIIVSLKEGANDYFADFEPQRRRRMTIDLLICFVAPIYVNIVYYIVQPVRYTLIQHNGCGVPSTYSWVTIPLYAIWPVLCSIIASGYTLLTMHRFYIRRGKFSYLIKASNSGISNESYIRLFMYTFLVTFIVLPICLIWFATIIKTGITRFSWDEIHNKETWNMIPRIPQDKPYYQSWLPIVSSGLSFIFFGYNRDSKDFYRNTGEKVRSSFSHAVSLVSFSGASKEETQSSKYGYSGGLPGTEGSDFNPELLFNSKAFKEKRQTPQFTVRSDSVSTFSTFSGGARDSSIINVPISLGRNSSKDIEKK